MPETDVLGGPTPGQPPAPSREGEAKKKTRTVGGLDIVEEGREDTNTHDLSIVPVAEILKAKDVELDRFDEFDAHDSIPREEAKKRGYKHLSARWEIMVRHGVVKARFVCREFKGNDTSMEYFAATSTPLVARVIDVWIIELLLLAFLFDASSAFLHVPELEDVTVDPPQEWLDRVKAPPGTVWKMKKTLYGRRSAASAWTNWLAGVLVAMGLEQNVAFPTLFKSLTSKIRVLTHMDDGYGGGTRDEVENFRVEFQKRVKASFEGPLGIGSRYSFLGGERERTMEGMVIRPAPRYIINYLKGAGLEESKPVKTPCSDAHWNPEDADPLNATDHSNYRSQVGIVQHLTAYRPDILFAVKELGRWLSTPTSGTQKAMKHLGRYLGGTKDYCLLLRRSERHPQQPYTLHCVSDSNWAHCRKTRRSTHCGHLSFGESSPMVTRAATQSQLAQSSGESEWYGGCSCAADGLLLGTVLRWLGFEELQIILWLDSTAARGMALRTGVSKMRTVELKTLWLQQKVREKLLVVRKISGLKNAADLGTKCLTAERTWFLAQKCGVINLQRGQPAPTEVARCLSSVSRTGKRTECTACTAVGEWAAGGARL